MCSLYRRELEIVTADDVKPQVQEWFIDNWIPASSLTLIAGREGTGKSSLAIRIVADATQSLAGDRKLEAPLQALYIHTEEDRERTIVPRLIAAHADLSKVHFIDVKYTSSESEEEIGGTLQLPRDIELIRKLLADNNIDIVVLDAATSVMDADLQTNADRDVRKFLEPLVELANDLNIVVLGIAHFGKKSTTDSGKLIIGSAAWSQVPRCVLSFARDNDTDELIITQTKSNLSKDGASKAGHIEGVDVRVEGQDYCVGTFFFDGDTDRDARELLARLDEDTAVGRASKFLVTTLRRGEMEVGQVIDLAEEQGISKNAIYRARDSLGCIGSKKTGHRNGRVLFLIESKINEDSNFPYTRGNSNFPKEMGNLKSIYLPVNIKNNKGNFPKINASRENSLTTPAQSDIDHTELGGDFYGNSEHIPQEKIWADDPYNDPYFSDLADQECGDSYDF